MYAWNKQTPEIVTNCKMGSAQQISLQQALFNKPKEHKGLIRCATPKFCIHRIKNMARFQNVSCFSHSLPTGSAEKLVHESSQVIQPFRSGVRGGTRFYDSLAPTTCDVCSSS